MKNTDTGFKLYLSALNKRNKGSIIYTGNPDFNEKYLSKHWTLRKILNREYPKPLATRIQELELAVDFYKHLVIIFLPKIHDFYRNKKVRRANAKKDRTPKPKPTKDFLNKSRNNYHYEHDTYHGWLKAVTRDFELCEKTINKILKE